MNIEQNLDRIIQAKSAIIRSLQEKNSDIPDNTLIDNIPTYIENLPTSGGEGGGNASGELTQKYPGATVLRIVVPHENYDFTIKLCGNSNPTYDVDWGDDIIEYQKKATEVQHHIYSKPGVYDINIFNLSENVFFGSCENIEMPGGITNYISTLFNNRNNDVWNNKYYIIKHDNICTDIILGDKITKISEYAFTDNNTLKNIKMGNIITYIEGSCFQNCYNLSTVALSTSVSTIRSSTFQNCHNLSSINLSSVTSIDTYAFQNCHNLSSIDLSSVTSINSYAFQNCYSLAKVILPSSLTSIANYSFSTCRSLQHLVIPPNFKTLGNYAFQNCYSLNTIVSQALTAPTIYAYTFPNSTSYAYTKRYIYIYKDATGYDSGNWQTYLINKGWEIRYIEEMEEKIPTVLKLKTTDNFFQRLDVLGNAELINYELINDEYIYYFDNDIEEIGAFSFYKRALKNIVVPEGVEVLYKSFNQCTSLEEVDLPSTLTTIDEYSFSGCTNLHTLICRSMVAPTSANATWNNIGSKVPSGVKKRLLIYRNATGYDSSNTYWNELFNKGFTIEYLD